MNNTTKKTNCKIINKIEHRKNAYKQHLSLISHKDCPIISNLFDNVSKQTLRKTFKYYDFHCSVQSRYDYLLKIKSYLKKSSLSKRDKALKLADLQAHLDYCSDISALLDINNTIDHPIYDKLSSFPDELSSHYHGFTDYIKTFRKIDLDIYFSYKKDKKSFSDEATRFLLDCQFATRRAMYIQRLNAECTYRADQGWYFIFDSITLAPDELRRFLDDPQAIRNYTRRYGRLVNKALGRPAKDRYQDDYKFFCVPEFGEKNGRFHYHCLHMLRALPSEYLQDPNFCGYSKKVNDGKSVIIKKFQGFWEYGLSAPMPVRFIADAFSRNCSWTALRDSRSIAHTMKPIQAVIGYIAKYVSKGNDHLKTKKLQRSKQKWFNHLNQVKLTQKRVRKTSMSKNFGLTEHIFNTMCSVKPKTLLELNKLDWTVTPFAKLIKKQAEKHICLKLDKLNLRTTTDLVKSQTSLLSTLRALTDEKKTLSQLNFTDCVAEKLKILDISDDCFQYLEQNKFFHKEQRFSEAHAGR